MTFDLVLFRNFLATPWRCLFPNRCLCNITNKYPVNPALHCTPKTIFRGHCGSLISFWLSSLRLASHAKKSTGVVPFQCGSAISIHLSGVTGYVEDREVDVQYRGALLFYCSMSWAFSVRFYHFRLLMSFLRRCMYHRDGVGEFLGPSDPSI